MLHLSQLLAHPELPSLIAWIKNPSTAPVPQPFTMQSYKCEIVVDFVKSTASIGGAPPVSLPYGLFLVLDNKPEQVQFCHAVADGVVEVTSICASAITDHITAYGNVLYCGRYIVIPNDGAPGNSIVEIPEHIYNTYALRNLKQHIRSLLIYHLNCEKHHDRDIAVDPLLFNRADYHQRISDIYTRGYTPAKMVEALSRLRRIYTPIVPAPKTIKQLEAIAAALDY